MQKKLTLICILICASFLVVAQQTTLVNYNYISKGHDLEVNNGLAPNPNYSVVRLRIDTCQISTDCLIISTISTVYYFTPTSMYQIGYKVEMKDIISGKLITVCKPTNESAQDVMQLYLKQINGLPKEFTTVWNQIISRLL